MGGQTEVVKDSGLAVELARARDLFAGVLDAATEQSIIGLDADGLITVFNAGAERMLGYTADEVIGLPIPPALHDPAEVQARADELGVEPSFRVVVGQAVVGGAETRQWTNITKDGRRLKVQVSATAMHDVEGKIVGYIKVGTDITARVDAEQNLRSTEARFEAVFDQAPIGMLLAGTSDADSGRMRRVNHALCQITGLTQGQLLSMRVHDLVHPAHRDVQYAAFDSLSHGAQPVVAAERRWIHADGHDIWVQISGSVITIADQPLMVGMVEDITARMDAERRLTHLAMHDALTGLPNRALLLDRIGHELAATRRTHHHVVVFFIDLDGFKGVNDTAGHRAGDEVLQMVAQRLQSCVRPGDTVARLGGDEFVVVCPNFQTDDHTETLARRLLDTLAEPFIRGDGVHQLSASLGIAVSAPTHPDAEALLRAADDAMYAAKNAGKNQAVRHRPDSELVTRAARQIMLESELLTALDNEEFILHGQPILTLPGRDVIAIETLIRWKHPTRGLLPPASFLDVAENSPLIQRIGRWVLGESCRIGAALPSPSDPSRSLPSVFVNVSGRQLEAGHFHCDVLDALTASGLDAHRLVLELTETTTPLISGSVLDDIENLRARGVRLAIDDVGTGYSSLSRFTQLPVDILKIDREFVGQIGESTAVDAVIDAILTIGRSLKLQVVAEGVETATQETRLQQAGCDTVQGFFYSTPQPEDHLRQLVITHTAVTASPESAR